MRGRVAIVYHVTDDNVDTNGQVLIEVMLIWTLTMLPHAGNGPPRIMGSWIVSTQLASDINIQLLQSMLLLFLHKYIPYIRILYASQQFFCFHHQLDYLV